MDRFEKTEAELKASSSQQRVKNVQSIAVIDDHLPPENKGAHTTTQKVCSKRTTKVETRVQRQILMRDGEVVADSGPQVFTRTSEDSHTEHSDQLDGNTNADKAVLAIDDVDLHSRPIVANKSDIRDVTCEARKECFQYRSEEVKELNGPDVADMLRIAPNKLFEPIEEEIDERKKGSILSHYSNKSKKFSKRDKVCEISRLGPDGNIYTETTQTCQNEEIEDDELPDVEYGRITAYSPPKSPNKTSRLAIGYRPIEYQHADDVENVHTNSWLTSHFGEEERREDSYFNNAQQMTTDASRRDQYSLEQQKKRQPSSKNASEKQQRAYSTLPKNTKFTRKEDASCQACFDSDTESDVSLELDQRSCVTFNKSGNDDAEFDKRSNVTYSKSNFDNPKSFNCFYFGDNANNANVKPASKPAPTKSAAIVIPISQVASGTLCASAPEFESGTTRRRRAEERQRSVDAFARVPPPPTQRAWEPEKYERIESPTAGKSSSLAQNHAWASKALESKPTTGVAATQVDWPEFSELSSPLEILNFTSAIMQRSN